MTRTEIINELIESHGYKWYLEIGVQDREANFNKIKCAEKYCIDPDPHAKADYVGTSDQWFRDSLKNAVFDIIFIDGLHHAIQFYKDILNSLDCLKTGGTIVCHDINPASLESQTVPRMQGEWNGDCWMAWVWLRATRSDLFMYVIDTDYGCGIITRGKQTPIIIDCNITYENLLKNKQHWLNLRLPKPK